MLDRSDLRVQTLSEVPDRPSSGITETTEALQYHISRRFKAGGSATVSTHRTCCKVVRRLRHRNKSAVKVHVGDDLRDHHTLDRWNFQSGVEDPSRAVDGWLYDFLLIVVRRLCQRRGMMDNVGHIFQSFVVRSFFGDVVYYNEAKLVKVWFHGCGVLDLVDGALSSNRCTNVVASSESFHKSAKANVTSAASQLRSALAIE